jgi:hypothetical protein
MRSELIGYFRCPDEVGDFQLGGRLSADSGYFRFGEDTVCFGRSSTGVRARSAGEPLYNALDDIRFGDAHVELPFDPDEVVENLRFERYVSAGQSGAKKLVSRTVRSAYYLLRPLLPVGVRKHLQKSHLEGWRNLAFPHWPVDTSVDALMQRLLTLAIKCNGGEGIPFIWFWPQGAPACAIMTHDVETQLGVEFCSRLMDLNEEFKVPSSFQVVPEERYSVPKSYLEEIRRRGFEVNVHDLNHDGRLYWDFEEFKRRAEKINRYGKEFGAAGFRAAVLYRNQDWYRMLNFEYDTSVPSVAHLDPQHGGCCTVMPYFVGDMVELPLTATQDYSLFHILNDYSTALWEQQFNIVLSQHGLINTIVHPDYINGPREEAVYRKLLQLYAKLRKEQNVWIALPKEANRWWRQRSRLRLVAEDGNWRIEGVGKERARIAVATLAGERLQYRILGPSERLASDVALAHPAVESV